MLQRISSRGGAIDPAVLIERIRMNRTDTANWSQTALKLATATLAVGCFSGTVAAADATFTSEPTFLAASGGLLMESFESLPGSVRALNPIVTPLMTLVPGVAAIGVQTGPTTPQDGFGASASNGSNYVSVYAPNAAPGTLTFNLAQPSTAFGFTLSDAAEVAGFIRLATNVGAFSGGVDIYSFSSGQGNALQLFVGLTQDLPFTQVRLTLNGFDEAYGVDEVYITAVPEPTTAWSLAAGLLGVAAALRRRRLPAER